MKQFISRMLAEKAELETRIIKAESALKILPYGMDAKDKELLAKQIEHMKDYLAVLTARINKSTGGKNA